MRVAARAAVVKPSSWRQIDLLATILLDKARRWQRVYRRLRAFSAWVTLNFDHEFFRHNKDLTGIGQRGPQNAYLTGIFRNARHLKYLNILSRRHTRHVISTSKFRATHQRLANQFMHRPSPTPPRIFFI
jgi:hypothetical protein